MNYRNVSIILIVILLIIIGIITFNIITAKYDSEISLSSNTILDGGENLTFKLTDLKKQPISNQKVKVTIENNTTTVKTDSNGFASVNLENFTPGKHSMKIHYKGNNHFKQSSLVQLLVIKNSGQNQQVEKNVSQYGYCKSCGKQLTYAEANDDYTQGKYCYNCAGKYKNYDSKQNYYSNKSSYQKDYSDSSKNYYGNSSKKYSGYSSEKYSDDSSKKYSYKKYSDNSVKKYYE